MESGGVKLSLWEDGPKPGHFYSFPGSSSSGPGTACGPVRHTLNPMVTGTSVLGVKFTGGVVIAADMLGSYGSLARFRNISRLMKVNNSTILGLFSHQVAAFLLSSFLGYVDKLGVAYEAPTVATGFGAYLAQPLMREVVENKVEITKQEARELVERCLKVLYYRDARSYNRHEIAIVTEEGVEIVGPLSSETNWDIAHMVSGFE
uniref:Proteasome subunit beta type-4 n=1 Tax=Neolamprologus brichardi TaxID=32507 RepID=A0A3Q4HYY6_NEOBR